MAGLAIRPAGDGDRDAIWSILRPVYRAGETYCIPRDIDRAAALADWFAPPFSVFVARQGGDGGPIVGTSHIGANRPGGGSHVANAGFATHPDARGRGVARALAEHALGWAAGQGFAAMQFNFVVASNQGAVRLWQRCGFQIVGRLPGAFMHPALGAVDALVMYRRLQGAATTAPCDSSQTDPA